MPNPRDIARDEYMRGLLQLSPDEQVREHARHTALAKYVREAPQWRGASLLSWLRSYNPPHGEYDLRLLPFSAEPYPRTPEQHRERDADVVAGRTLHIDSQNRRVPQGFGRPMILRWAVCVWVKGEGPIPEAVQVIAPPIENQDCGYMEPDETVLREVYLSQRIDLRNKSDRDIQRDHDKADEAERLANEKGFQETVEERAELLDGVRPQLVTKLISTPGSGSYRHSRPDDATLEELARG